MNRRQFLTGVSAAAVASALPAAPVNPIVGMDLALPDSERTALWIIESTPSMESSYFATMYYRNVDWAPMEFTGFESLVPKSEWVDTLYPVVRAS